MEAGLPWWDGREEQKVVERRTLEHKYTCKAKEGLTQIHRKDSKLTCNPRGDRNHSQSWDNQCFQGRAWKAWMKQFSARGSRVSWSRGGQQFSAPLSHYILFVFENGHQGVKPENVHLGQPLARASRVEWGIGGLYFTVKDWRSGQWSATSPITAAASSLAVMLSADSWLHLNSISIYDMNHVVVQKTNLDTRARTVAVSAKASPSREREGHREGSL